MSQAKCKGEKRTASDSSNILDQHTNNLNKSKRHLVEESEMHEDTPEWAKVFFTFMVQVESMLNQNSDTTQKLVEEKFNEVTKSIEFVSADCREMKTSISKTETKLVDHEKKLVTVTTNLQMLEEKQLQAEIHQRKNNMVFCGIKESDDPKNERCEKSVRDVLTGIPNNENIYIGRCHRLGAFIPGQHRDIIAHMPLDNDKSTIIENRKLLPDKIYTREDLPHEISLRRKELLPIFKLAKGKENYKNINVKLKQDKLVIGRSTYTIKPINNLATLPQDLNPVSACERSDENSIIYFGKHHPFSNFYPCDLTINGEKYPTAEHYIQEQKALYFSNNALSIQIKSASSPAEAKSLAKNINNYSHREWINQVPNILDCALRNKMAQNEICLHYLQSTGKKRIGEATFDKFYGIGLGLEEQSLSTANWHGMNLMGASLEKVRSKLGGG